MSVVTTEVNKLIREAAVRFLRGDTSVVDFTYEFRRALVVVARTRPLQGLELDLFEALEQWETARWSDRPTVVDRLRFLGTLIAGSAGEE